MLSKMGAKRAICSVLCGFTPSSRGGQELEKDDFRWRAAEFSRKARCWDPSVGLLVLLLF